MSLLDVGKMFSNALPWLQVGFDLFSTVRSVQGAGAIEAEGRYNAQAKQEEADAAWRAYEDRAAILRDQQGRFLATQTTNFAKSGVTLQGTPMEVLNDMVYRQHLDQVALYDTASVEYKRTVNEGHMAEWQAYQRASSVRDQAFSNFGASLLSTQTQFAAPWTKSTTDAVTAAAAPETAGPHYTQAEANAVPGSRGWRPMRSSP